MVIKNFKQIALFVLAIVAISFTSCKDDDNKLPPIDGYNNADEVASTNLVAYWGLNGDGKEAKSSTSPSKSDKSSFVTGKKGQALDLAGGYLLYPEIASLNSLKSFTVSLWANGLKNNGSHASILFSLGRANEWAGSINIMAETGWRKAGDDTLTIKGLIVSNAANGASWQDSRNDIAKGGDQVFTKGNQWSQYVISYDATTEKFKVFANGVKVSNPDWETRTGLGELKVFTPSIPIIGAWWTNTGGTPDSWQVPFTGQIDEIRIFNKALSDAELSALYKLEPAGR